jgi:hypothetical protein
VYSLSQDGQCGVASVMGEAYSAAVDVARIQLDRQKLHGVKRVCHEFS